MPEVKYGYSNDELFDIMLKEAKAIEYDFIYPKDLMPNYDIYSILENFHEVIQEDEYYQQFGKLNPENIKKPCGLFDILFLAFLMDRKFQRIWDFKNEVWAYRMSTPWRR